MVSVSPQSRAALAAYHGVPPAEALRRLTGFFKGLGVRAVLDTNTGRDLALLEAAAEFIERYRAAHPELAGCVGYSSTNVWSDPMAYIMLQKAPYHDPYKHKS